MTTKNTTAELSALTKDAEFDDLGLGEVCALVERLTGELQAVILPGGLEGHVGHGCHPTMVSLQTQSTHDSSVLGDRQPWSVAFSVLGERERKRIREKNNPLWFVLANTDGKLAAIITDVVVCDK